MPRLADDIAAEADKAASEDQFEVIPEGLYVGKLESVEVSDEPGASGHHYWMWKFRIQDEHYTHSQQNFITSLSPKARFSIGQAFAAFGVPSNTHTDELIGELAMLQVLRGPIERGSRKGQIGNTVQFISAYEGELERSEASDF